MLLRNWLVNILTGMQDDKLFPDAVFVERSQWQGINDDVAAGLGGLIDQLSKTKESIRQQRAVNNLDALYCR